LLCVSLKSVLITLFLFVVICTSLAVSIKKGVYNGSPSDTERTSLVFALTACSCYIIIVATVVQQVSPGLPGYAFFLLVSDTMDSFHWITDTYCLLHQSLKARLVKHLIL